MKEKGERQMGRKPGSGDVEGRGKERERMGHSFKEGMHTWKMSKKKC